MTIGEKVRAARKSVKLTQQKLAEASGVSGISIRNYENEKRQHTIAQLQKIANGLGMSVTDLIDGKFDAAREENYSFCPLIQDTCRREKCAWSNPEYAGRMCSVRVIAHAVDHMGGDS